jgi:uncharacterized protein (TIGR02452 family)
MDKKLALRIAPITADELYIDEHVVVALENATKQIITHGAYINADGEDVYIEDEQEFARANTIVYTPHHVIPSARPKYPESYGFVHNQTTLTVAHERHKLGYRVVLINCSTVTDTLTTSPQVYPESILRSSSLLYCLEGGPFDSDTLDEFRDDTIVVTPQVPIFRNHEGNLLRSPWHADIVTAAPVHALDVQQYAPSRAAEIAVAMARRAQRLVDAAAATAANVLVVGAWGCGVHGNDAELVATVLRVACERPAARAFAIVDVAVADTDPATPLYLTFAKHFQEKKF